MISIELLIYLLERFRLNVQRCNEAEQGEGPIYIVEAFRLPHDVRVGSFSGKTLLEALGQLHIYVRGGPEH